MWETTLKRRQCRVSNAPVAEESTESFDLDVQPIENGGGQTILKSELKVFIDEHSENKNHDEGEKYVQDFVVKHLIFTLN